MKADPVFPLDSADWPVLLLEEPGTVVRSNPAARKTFGRAVEANHPFPAGIWSPANELALDSFLAAATQSQAPLPPVRLLTTEGRVLSYQPYACTVPAETKPYTVLQLLPAKPPGEAAPKAEIPAPDLQLPAEPPGQEATAAQRQKLECALHLARTVALDFNNALTSILGHTSLILSKMEPSHPWRNSLVEVEKSAEKAAEVASDLAAFSRQEKEVRSRVAGNLNDLVRRTVELFQAPASKPIAWALQLEPRLYTAAFDEAKLQQAFAKILDNAIQAVPANGQIAVRTRNQDVAEATHDGNVRLAAGHYVCVEVDDSGCGIAPEVLPRIFEPFFSTKNSPVHRGLGLAWVYGIVTNHGGSVAVSSQLRRGTSVRIYLPAQKKIVRDRTLPSDDLSGTETILLIDDEELLLTMGEMVLSSFGYRVLTANSGPTALQLFTEAQEQIDLVITDLVMPRMSGREVIEQLRKLAPGIRIICSSGYVRALDAEEEEHYLQKPYTSLDLLRTVKQALTTGEGS